jgi:ubiquinone/menaquinone biosynthesis C-methylase UbiE
MAESLNQCAGPFGTVYDFYVERPWLMHGIGRLVWGIDAPLLYESIESTIPNVPDGATILDVPCGGGVAFRGLRPDQDVRYIAGDLSEKMLARASERARAASLEQVELVTADMLALPFPSGTADLFVSYSGLHMVKDQEHAVQEIARCLKPGGELVGTTFLREGSRRQRMLFALGHRQGHALPPRREDLHRWLLDAGFEGVKVQPESGFVAIRARRA